MVWPATNVGTATSDAGNDSPAQARADIQDLIQKFNQLRQHVNSLMQTILNVGAYTPTVQVAYAGTIVVDAALSNVFEIGVLTGNINGIVWPNFAAGRVLMLRFTQDGVGGRSVAVSGGLVQGSINTAPNKTSWLTIVGTNVGGAHWEGSWLLLP